ncbi:MAG: hypothetical protein ABIH69_03880 [bacterium]
MDMLRQLNVLRKKAFCAAGKPPIYVELGCGKGDFAMDLSKQERKWVVGIDECPGLAESSLSRYARAVQFLLLEVSYEEWIKGTLPKKEMGLAFFAGRASKAFMIMPFALPQNRDFSLEIAIWQALASKDSELHIRTEVPVIKKYFQQAFLKAGLSVREIPFAQEAKEIPSLSTNLIRDKRGLTIYDFAFKLC